MSHITFCGSALLLMAAAALVGNISAGDIRTYYSPGDEFGRTLNPRSIPHYVRLTRAAQSIRGYASNIPPYSTSNTKFSDYHKKNPGRPLPTSGINDGAYSKETAETLRPSQVSNARRFGSRG